MPYETFGSRISARRVESGISLVEVADLVGVEPLVIQKLEAGQMVPSFEVLFGIAGVLALDAGELWDLAYPLQWPTEW